MVILTGNLGAGGAFFGANDSEASIPIAVKSKFGEKRNMSKGAPWLPSGNWALDGAQVIFTCSGATFVLD
jgi:hypothetical protein